MPTILITGANRGLGLEFVRQYLNAEWRVFACCRKPNEAHELNELAQANLQVLTLDVANFTQIDQLAEQLYGETIDTVLSNAGIYGDTHDDDFGHIDYEQWAYTFRVNSMAGVKLAEAFLPHLRRAPRPLFAALTSLMGSMTDNRSGGSILYRSSKAALNAAMKSLSIDLKEQNIGILLLHPGWVLTDMGGSHAPTLPETSIAGMRRVMAEFTLEQSGTFINFKGDVLPW